MREGWTYKKLGDVASFSRGLTYSKSDVATESSKKVLRSNNIDLATWKSRTRLTPEGTRC